MYGYNAQPTAFTQPGQPLYCLCLSPLTYSLGDRGGSLPDIVLSAVASWQTVVNSNPGLVFSMRRKLLHSF